MNVLILSCNTGGGHNAAARAVMEALRRRGHTCKMVDYLALASDFVSKEVCGAYVSIVNHAPSMFNLIYKAGALVSSPHRRSPIYYINRTYVRFLRREFAAAHYDAVVVSHIFAAQALTELRRRGELNIPFLCIATDYTCSPFWEEVGILHGHTSSKTWVLRTETPSSASSFTIAVSQYWLGTKPPPTIWSWPQPGGKAA